MTTEALLLRLRPILMTSFAFILGIVPLAIATVPVPKCVAHLASPFSAACLMLRYFGAFSSRYSSM